MMERLEFVLTTTYFIFRGEIYQQRFGTAMGNPVSPIVVNLYMEYVEKEVLASVLVECKPKYWKKYGDDILAIIKKEIEEMLTNHFHTVADTMQYQIHT